MERKYLRALGHGKNETTWRATAGRVLGGGAQRGERRDSRWPWKSAVGSKWGFACFLGTTALAEAPHPTHLSSTSSVPLCPVLGREGADPAAVPEVKGGLHHLQGEDDCPAGPAGRAAEGAKPGTRRGGRPLSQEAPRLCACLWLRARWPCLRWHLVCHYHLLTCSLSKTRGHA